MPWPGRVAAHMSRHPAWRRRRRKTCLKRVNVHTVFSTSYFLVSLTCHDCKSLPPLIESPGTFVPLPLSKAPSGIANFFEYYWARIRFRAVDIFSLFAIKMGSKPSYFKKARFTLNRTSVIPTARALHRTMSEALASGDKETLQKVCATQLYLDLCRAIDQRPRGRRYGWEVVRYTRPLRFPRIVDHKLAIFGDAASGAPGIRQAVVAISSRQRRVEYDDARGGAAVPGSEREMDVVEYLVINRTVDMKTYAQSDWRVWGTLNETSLPQLRDDIALMNRAQEEEKQKMREKRKDRLAAIRRSGQ